jgi:precorrin-2 dehydrogenase/sirohydrochlorin ferrochelatase
MEYPVNLQLQDRRCVVIGGGLVAERKVEALVGANACVTVVAPAVTYGLARLSEQGAVEWINRHYQQGDLEGYFLAICATNCSDINAAAAAEARAQGTLVNVVDAPKLCDFTMPSYIARGELLITVSTGGKSPALTKRLREELESLYGPEYGYFLEIIGRARENVRTQLAISREREQFWRQTIDMEMVDLLREGKFKEAEERLHNAISRIGTQS